MSSLVLPKRYVFADFCDWRESIKILSGRRKFDEGKHAVAKRLIL